ncbi:MAG: hypothetical protein ACI9EK_001419 [Psychroserpens sp.]|jgi:hypothetical protein
MDSMSISLFIDSKEATLHATGQALIKFQVIRKSIPSFNKETSIVLSLFYLKDLFEGYW